MLTGLGEIPLLPSSQISSLRNQCQHLGHITHPSCPGQGHGCPSAHSGVRGAWTTLEFCSREALCMQRGQPALPQSPHTGVARPLQSHCGAEQQNRAVAASGTPRLALKAAPHPASAAGAVDSVSPDGCAPGVALLLAFFSRIRSSSCRTCSRRLRRSAVAAAGTGGSWANWASAFTLCRRHRSPARSSWVGRGHRVRAGLAHRQETQKNGAESQACHVPAANVWLSPGCHLCWAVSPHPVPRQGSGWCWPGGLLPGPARVVSGGKQWLEARGWRPAKEWRSIRSCPGTCRERTPPPRCPPHPWPCTEGGEAIRGSAVGAGGKPWRRGVVVSASGEGGQAQGGSALGEGGVKPLRGTAPETVSWFYAPSPPQSLPPSPF